MAEIFVEVQQREGVREDVKTRGPAHWPRSPGLRRLYPSLTARHSARYSANPAVFRTPPPPPATESRLGAPLPNPDPIYKVQVCSRGGQVFVCVRDVGVVHDAAVPALYKRENEH